jgi:16S rRNA (cytidine1402-2'-O)-methyltransferase
MGSLILIPTPIHDPLPLEPEALALLQKVALDPEWTLLVEELKTARTRWLRWGLPREAIARFVTLNEHDQADSAKSVLESLKKGGSAVLISDCGLPAFCDPGRILIDACHREGLRVSSTPFPNSVALAVALSGFPHEQFFFAGFLPADSTGRKQALERLSRIEETLVIMDTPYRFRALLEDIARSKLQNRQAFVATGLNAPSERLFRGSLSELLVKTGELTKPEFVLVLNAHQTGRRN